VSPRQGSPVPRELLPPHIGRCQSSATSIFQPPPSCRITTSSQHAQPSGVLRRRSDGLECAAWRPPRPVAQCRQFPEKAKDASVSECTWTLSALEALRNALYKLKTYLLTYLYSSIYHFKLGNLAHCNKYWISRHIFSCRLLVVGHISYLCSALCTLKPKKTKNLKTNSKTLGFFQPWSVAVCDIFSVKEWCDLENMVKVRSRSLEMAPFDRSHTISYSPSILIMALSCIVCEL